MKILTEDYKYPLDEKYGKVIVQVATLEERIKSFKDFGLMDRATELNDALIELLESIKKEYVEDSKNRKRRRRW